MINPTLMHQQFEKLKSARKFLITLIEDLIIEQLNQVPAGFNNNIIWNLAHLLPFHEGLHFGTILALKKLVKG